VDGVSFAVGRGETVCLVGESGSGKSASVLSIARLLPSPPARYLGGQILLEGRDVLRMRTAELRKLRGDVVSYVFQEPAASLNPVMQVGRQILEALRLHRPEAANRAELIRLMGQVGIASPEERLRQYPHQLSGGTQQRVMIAMALASHPRLLIADEPTTALDVTIQAQILDLLGRLKTDLGMSMVLITHNLGIVGEIADRVAVMHAGQIVECGPPRDILRHPLHPYTQALLDSVPRLGETRERLRAIPGSVPLAGAWPTGCRFHPRCPIARPDCALNAPSLSEPAPGRLTRCPYTSLAS
jgi:oligopeptide/dipeptide ABC transporter ATP-binding protein